MTYPLRAQPSPSIFILLRLRIPSLYGWSPPTRNPIMRRQNTLSLRHVERTYDLFHDTFDEMYDFFFLKPIPFLFSTFGAGLQATQNDSASMEIMSYDKHGLWNDFTYARRTRRA